MPIAWELTPSSAKRDDPLLAVASPAVAKRPGLYAATGDPDFQAALQRVAEFYLRLDCLDRVEEAGG